MGNYNLFPPQEVFPKAKSAAMKALELDDTDAEAHRSLAWVRMCYERDWQGAEKALLRYIELNPSRSEGYYDYAYWLSAMGRTDEAVTASERARELDPVWVAQNRLVGRMLYFARRHDEAIHEYGKTLEMNPDDVNARMYLGWAYLTSRRFAEAISQVETWFDLTGGRRIGPLAHAYASAGRVGEAHELLDELLGLPNKETLFPGDISLVYTELGEKDEAFAWLDKAVDAFDARLFQLQDPMWDPLRDDPRFEDLLRGLNLPVEVLTAVESQ